jgi:Phage stabilisation protein
MRIPLFGLGMASRSPYVTAKLLQNLYVEQRPQGEKSFLVAYQTPGLELFVDTGDTPWRGGIEFETGNVAYAVHLAKLYEINNAGVLTARGTLNTTSGRVSMAHNGVQVMIVDGSDGYIYNTTTTAFSQITAAGFPDNPTTVGLLGRRFIVSVHNSGRFYVSAIDDGLSWSALDFANAESNADPIIAVWVSNGQIILLGSQTTEFWGHSGALDFPFSALQGTANEWGIGARWSLAKYDNSFACLIKGRMGEVMVAKMNGYLPQRISTPDLDAIINDYSTTEDASAYSYMLGGHAMYAISFPTAGASWLYDGATGIWSKLKSFGQPRHRAQFSLTLLGKTLVADHALGRLYRLTPAMLTDNGESIEREIVGETIAGQDNQGLSIDCLRLDMETGIGTTIGQGANPQIALSCSRDNGKTWGPDLWKSAGARGEYGTRVEWRRLGTTNAFTPKIRITDPVPAVFVSAVVNPPN